MAAFNFPCMQCFAIMVGITLGSSIDIYEDNLFVQSITVNGTFAPDTHYTVWNPTGGMVFQLWDRNDQCRIFAEYQAERISVLATLPVMRLSA